MNFITPNDALGKRETSIKLASPLVPDTNRENLLATKKSQKIGTRLDASVEPKSDELNGAAAVTTTPRLKTDARTIHTIQFKYME
jgi:hypothetical protein